MNTPSHHIVPFGFTYHTSNAQDIMAQDGEQPKPVDKGKGKAVDGEPTKPEEVKKDKDGKPIVNGKKEEAVVGGTSNSCLPTSLANRVCAEELSEEDQQLKSELDMLVERLTVCFELGKTDVETLMCCSGIR